MGITQIGLLWAIKEGVVLFKKIKNAKSGVGIVGIIIGLTMFTIITISVSKFLVYQLKNTIKSSAVIQQNLILENEWNKINIEKTETIFEKKNTTETKTVTAENMFTDSDEYVVNINYGYVAEEKTDEENLISMPVTISVYPVNDETKKTERTGKIYSNSTMDYGLVKNNSAPHSIGVKYNKEMDNIEYYYDDKQVMKPPSSFETGNGYVKFNNGLIMQFGNVQNSWFDESHLETIGFPYVFPHDCLIVLTSVQKFSGARLTAYVHDYNRNYWNCLPGFSGDEGHGTYYWIAIGY